MDSTTDTGFPGKSGYSSRGLLLGVETSTSGTVGRDPTRRTLPDGSRKVHPVHGGETLYSTESPCSECVNYRTRVAQSFTKEERVEQTLGVFLSESDHEPGSIVETWIEDPVVSLVPEFGSRKMSVP